MPPQSAPPPGPGVYVPADLIYTANLPPAAIHTWMQLRGLAVLRAAEGAYATPPLTIHHLAAHTGKSQSALYAHLARLKACGALRWRSIGNSRLIITFDAADTPCAPDEHPEPSPAALSTFQESRTPDSTFSESRIQESGIQESGIQDSGSSSSSSFKPLKLINQSNPDGEKEEEKEEDKKPTHNSTIQESRKTTPRPPRPKTSNPRATAAATRTPPGSSTLGSSTLGSLSDPVEIYQSLMHRRPTPPQRQEIYERVTDPDLWRKSLAHWQMHAWNPRNLPSILDFYTRGGPAACYTCTRQKETTSGRPSPMPASDPFDELINEYRQQQESEIKHGRPR